jgi:hypothetical protein
LKKKNVFFGNVFSKKLKKIFDLCFVGRKSLEYLKKKKVLVYRGKPLVRVIQKTVYLSAGQQAPSAQQPVFAENFACLFFWKKFENSKTNTILFSKIVYVPEY